MTQQQETAKNAFQKLGKQVKGAFSDYIDHRIEMAQLANHFLGHSTLRPKAPVTLKR